MAINKVPKISGPDYGGVIYGLNMSIGYSAEPSKLTLDIVNENGSYGTPSLNSSVTVSFGDFRFNGTVWSYNLKESAAEKTLQVTIIDNSVILDRYYVLLWKRGLLGLSGSPISKEKTFDFSDESILAPQRNDTFEDYPFTQFKEKRLSRQTENIKSRSLGGQIFGQNTILVGHEKFPASDCDIPDTYYTFDDLKAVLPINGDFPSNKVWRATHEGTLREVLSSWASDLGFDYYWDFKLNKLVFFDVSKGISTLQNIASPNIISKESSSSMEGTFRQYGIGYTQIPRSALKTLTYNNSRSITYSVSPYSLDYFLKRIGAPQSLSTERSKWGANRSSQDFRHASLLGFISRSLRDLYSFQNEHWEALGYTVNSGINVNKAKMISFLKKAGFEMISDLETFDAKGLPNYNFNYINRDVTLSDKWFEIEQFLLDHHGKYYRIPDSSGSFFYCSSQFTIEIEISVDPEGQTNEELNQQFAGKKIFDRGGRLSHDAASAQELLGYEKLTNEIENCAPIHIDLKTSGILDNLIISGLLTAEQSKIINTLVIFPKSDKFVRQKIGFRSRLSRGTHPLEQTYIDIKNSNIKNGRTNCSQFEEKLRQGSCESIEEIARRKAIKAAGGNNNSQESEDDLVSGLVSKTAQFCDVSLKNGNVRVFTPSDASYRVICRYNINVNKISSVGTEEFLYSEGAPGQANDVAEIRISMENVTDPEEDSFQKRRNTKVIKPSDAQNTAPLQTIKYVFAGEPPGNLKLSPSDGLSNIDISLSSDGFTTSATFSSKPPKSAKANNTVRYVQSQLNRASYNAS